MVNKQQFTNVTTYPAGCIPNYRYHFYLGYFLCSNGENIKSSICYLFIIINCYFVILYTHVWFYWLIDSMARKF